MMGAHGLPLLLLDDFDHCWPDAWSQRWDRLLSLFRLLAGIGHFWWGSLLNCGADFLKMGVFTGGVDFS